MKNFLLSAMALTAVLVIPGVASANDVSDRTEAIHLCRSQVAADAGVDVSQARFDQVRLRGRLVRVDIDLWRNGSLQNIRCDVDRTGDALTVASITPSLQTASTTVPAAQ